VLLRRLPVLVAREVAHLLWSTNQSFSVPELVQQECQFLRDYLDDRNNLWEMQIGHFIPREPTFTSAGDSSLDGGGALSHILRFWFAFVWKPEIRRRLRLSHKHPLYLHINQMEFLIVILQVAAVTCMLTDYPQLLPPDTPAIPILHSLTDNTPSNKWASKVSSTSTRTQPLVAILGELLRHSDLGFTSAHIEGKLNVDPDALSRPNLTLSPSDRLAQMYLKMPLIKSYSFFQPAPELVSLLESSLCSERWQGHPVLPKKLGQFVPADCISSSFFTL
jgi:hypothetical protein